MTSTEIGLLDGGTSVGSSITLADADGFIVNDGGTMKSIPASDIITYVQSGISLGAAQIDDNAIGASEIVALGVGTAELQAGAVTGAKLAADIVKTTGYVVVNADDGTAAGLVLRGKDPDGETQDYVLQVDGGVLALAEIGTVSESSAATGAAGS